jgi:hypothetical protein
MPIYESLCGVCKKVQEYVRPASQYLDTPFCCGKKTVKGIFTPPFAQVDIPAYVSPVSGKLINSRTQRKEDLKANNCRPWEGMEQEKKVAQERAKDEEKKADAKIEEAAVAAWNQLPSEKRRVLESA